jgi:hypothetical protein
MAVADSYIRSTDQAVMIEFQPGMYVSDRAAEALGLVSEADLKFARRREKARR